MKVEIEKYKADFTGLYMKLTKNFVSLDCEVKHGYTYYIFMSEEKAWIRHSGKLTKEEKQWVIQNENK